MSPPNYFSWGWPGPLPGDPPPVPLPLLCAHLGGACLTAGCQVTHPPTSHLRSLTSNPSQAPLLPGDRDGDQRNAARHIPEPKWGSGPEARGSFPKNSHETWGSSAPQCPWGSDKAPFLWVTVTAAADYLQCGFRGAGPGAATPLTGEGLGSSSPPQAPSAALSAGSWEVAGPGRRVPQAAGAPGQRSAWVPGTLTIRPNGRLTLCIICTAGSSL